MPLELVFQWRSKLIGRMYLNIWLDLDKGVSVYHGWTCLRTNFPYPPALPFFATFLKQEWLSSYAWRSDEGGLVLRRRMTFGKPRWWDTVAHLKKAFRYSVQRLCKGERSWKGYSMHEISSGKNIKKIGAKCFARVLRNHAPTTSHTWWEPSRMLPHMTRTLLQNGESFGNLPHSIPDMTRVISGTRPKYGRNLGTSSQT